MVTVYGADWCEDTQRTLRHLRRLGVAYAYENVDESPEALASAVGLNRGRRQTPTVDVDGTTLVEPANAELRRALEQRGLLDPARAARRLRFYNLGDVERGLRMAGGAVAAGAALRLRTPWKWPLFAWGMFELVSGSVGWCPVYSATGRTSQGGPGDHPREAERSAWLAQAVP